jgi:hypothetical protein
MSSAAFSTSARPAEGGDAVEDDLERGALDRRRRAAPTLDVHLGPRAQVGADREQRDVQPVRLERRAADPEPGVERQAIGPQPARVLG